MSEVERDWWESRAVDLSTFKRAVWDEDEALHDQRVIECLTEIEVRLGNVLKRATSKVLDLGCGWGRLTIPLAVKYPAVDFIGVDISPSAVALATVEAEQVEVGNVSFVVGDGRWLPKLPKLRGAFSVLCFQHMPHEAAAGYISQVAERLTKGSPLVFQHVIGDDDVFLSHQVSMEQVTKWCTDAGLIVEALDVGVIFPPWVWVTARKP